MLLAGGADFDIDHLKDLVPTQLVSEVVENVAGRLLMIKTETAFVAQIEAFDKEASEETTDDLARVEPKPPAFAEALAGRGLRFLLIAGGSEREHRQSVIDAFVKAGLVQFDCSDVIEVLA